MGCFGASSPGRRSGASPCSCQQPQPLAFCLPKVLPDSRRTKASGVRLAARVDVALRSIARHIAPSHRSIALLHRIARRIAPSHRSIALLHRIAHRIAPSHRSSQPSHPATELALSLPAGAKRGRPKRCKPLALSLHEVCRAAGSPRARRSGLGAGRRAQQAQQERAPAPCSLKR